ncbi:MAG TPA: hypothetical protein VMU13_00520 [Candidatus Paceibacterota bacterium]|nr:hypothetical protein [Candidatus Paceibacterota bacterium]
MVQWIENLNADILDGLIKGSALIAFIIISQGVIWFLKFRLRRHYTQVTRELADMDEVQQASLTYFRRRQFLDVIRASLLLVSLLIGVLFYNIQAFSFLALALGAVVINQKENINSVIAYFFILSNYQVGDDIGTMIGMMNSLGEIVRIGLFNTTLAGKDEAGEYNGKRISIPNYQFLLNPVEQQNLKTDTYRQIVMDIPYSQELYAREFEVFIKDLQAFLDELLPKRNLRQVGTFRGFAGIQYKINFDYNTAGCIVVRITFISRARDVRERKERIVTFVEHMKSAT